MEALNLQLYQILVDPAKIEKETNQQFAFIGRSNVGKSSLINLISKSKSIAKTSQTPGKTKTINFFSSQFPFYIVDLPGYGFAKVSKQERDDFNKRLIKYFSLQQVNLVLFILLDSRHTIQAIDKEFIRTAGEFEFPKVIVMTKTDKPNQKELAESRRSIKKFLEENHVDWPIIETSAQTGKGKSDILKIIYKLSS